MHLQESLKGGIYKKIMPCWRLYLNYVTTESCQICFPSISRSFKKSSLKITGSGGQQTKNIKWDLGKMSQDGSIWNSPNEIPRALWKHLKAMSWSVKGFLRTRFTKQQQVTSVPHLAELPMISPHSRLLRLTELEVFGSMNSQSLSQHTYPDGATSSFSKCPKPHCGIPPALPAAPRNCSVISVTKQGAVAFPEFNWMWMQWGCSDFTKVRLLSCKLLCITRSKLIAEEEEEQSLTLEGQQ